MRKFKILPLLLLLLTMATSVAAQKKTQKTYIPWNNGKLVVSEEGRYLKHENGTPFFWLGETGWLLPERLNRDEAEYYLEQCKRRGYNVIQVQTLNNVPSMNIYGQYSMIDGYNFKNINQKGVYGYWDHMDYIIRTAAKKGQYIMSAVVAASTDRKSNGLRLRYAQLDSTSFPSTTASTKEN